MANPLFVRTGIVAGVGTVAVLISFAAVTGVLPIRALISHAATPQAAAALDPVAMVSPTPLPAKTVGKVALVAPAPDRAALTLTHNDVVGGSFAALPAQLQKPATADTPKPVALDAAVTAPLSKRTVRVMAVKPDGTPDFSAQTDDGDIQTVAQAYAEPHRPPVRRDVPALDAATQIGAGQKPAIAEKAVQVASLDPAPVVAKPGGKTGVILGSGANVRSAPAKGNNKVLFALSGGTSVKLGDSRNGWWRVTDGKGRTGWVYKDYIKR